MQEKTLNEKEVELATNSDARKERAAREIEERLDYLVELTDNLRQHIDSGRQVLSESELLGVASTLTNAIELAESAGNKLAFAGIRAKTETRIADSQSDANFQALRSRWENSDGGMLILVKDNPKLGQLTQEELLSLDPQGSHSDSYAASAFVDATINNGNMSKEEFIKTVAADGNSQRAEVTINRMLEVGVLQLRSNKVYLNLTRG